ncbi:MAG: ABC transporter ATP-binding protein [Thermotaleaceae bacterium]
MTKKLLEVKDLNTHFFTVDGVVPAVDGISFTISKGETLGIVGESGSGKSVTARSIMRLVPHPPGKIISGSIEFNGEDLLSKKESEMREIRGRKIGMIFQDPMTSLNPLFTIGNQMIEAIMIHQKVTKREARDKAIEALKMVGIPSPETRMDNYPHNMSGGMRQRVMIAMALSCNPELLIADEPTTALDVTIQAQILDLIKEMKNKLNMSVLIITHDLGVVADVADNIIVMYAGKIMEYGTTLDLYDNPLHPYTKGLLDSIPTLDMKGERLKSIEGNLPNVSLDFNGCRFAERCSKKSDRCLVQEPELVKVNNSFVRCHKYVG